MTIKAASDLSYYHSLQIGIETHPAFFLMAVGSLFPGNENGYFCIT
jgi:hypothetical protein